MTCNKVLFYVLFCLSFLISFSNEVIAQKDNSSYAGMARVDITPPVGYSHYRGVSTGVHDSLYAKAVVFGKENRRNAIVICDLLYMDRELSIKARTLASNKTGIPYSSIIIAATHNHTSPGYNEYIDKLNEKLRPSSYLAPKTKSGEDYPDWLAERIAQSIIEANDKLVPVSFGIGSKNIGDIAFNRRFVLKDGTVRMNAGVGNPNIVGPAGPVDSLVRFILVRRISDNKPIGCISNFGLHADTFGGTEFSADYPGYLANSLRDEFGKDFISVFANGPCGDINHVNVKPGSKKLTSQVIGEKIGNVIKSEIPYLKKIKNFSLRSQSEYTYVPLQRYSKVEVKWALSKEHSESLYNRNPYALYKESPFLTVRRAVKIWNLYNMRKNGEAIPPTIGEDPWTIPLEIQVFSLSDDVAVVGLPGEVFTELGMAIRSASPFKTTLIIECSNILLPYVPTKEAFKQGGYETINSRLMPGGGEMMVQLANSLLKEISLSK